MSSINPHFTFSYSQPNEYRFSHDSVFLARRVFELYRNQQVRDLRLLDLCAGCGVVGLDFIFHCRQEMSDWPRHCDFVEVQTQYSDHLFKNCSEFAELESRAYWQPASALMTEAFKNRYDLILCNPPYFRLGQGKLSPCEFKNRCRYFSQEEFSSLFRFIQHALACGGRAYVLLRDLSAHGIDLLDEVHKWRPEPWTIQSLAEIRGTGLVEIQNPLPHPDSI